MANNVNSNLTQRLFAYMQHKIDLTPEIAELYKNSLIFLGDQKQIYVPLYNAYVGIGMDAYDEVTDRVDSIEQSVAELKEKSSTKTVSSLQVQRNHYHPDGMQSTDFDNIEIGEENVYAKSLNGDVLISGYGDYNLDTGFSYTNNWQYSEENGWTTVGTAQNKVAYSGIRISYYTNYIPDEVDGQVVSKPVGHQLVIDDHLTWAYMLGAYTYSLDFSRDFTNSRIETLYHDLLGVGETVYVPITYSDLFKEDPSNPGNDIYVEGDYWYKNGDTWVKLEGEPASGTQYYTQSTTYNNSYNMNIANGIQTLKEVAYILDQITDGALGGVTYVSKSEWDTISPTQSQETEKAIVNGKEIDVYSYTAGGKTYWRVISSNDKPTTNSKQYGYYITEANPDNIGIQIAYSIAGNNTAIIDLHEHIDYIEQGITTLRSTSYVNDIEGLISLSQWSTKPGFVSTDTEESLPDSSYKVGDVRSFAYLNLANTYLTYNHYVDKTATSIAVNPADIPTGVDSDVTRINIFEKVNFMNDLPQYSQNTYYKLVGSTMTKLTDGNYADWPTDRSQVESFTDKDIIYWIPANANGNEYGNNKFKQLTAAELLVESESSSNKVSYFYYKGDNDQYVQCTEKPTDTSTTYYYSADENTPYVQHAVIDTANHIATTAWVKGYFDDSQGEINDKIDNILDKAKQYTNEKISGLDNDTKYSYAYFNSWMTTRGFEFVETPGTSDSIIEHNSYFAQFVEESDATANQFDGSYVKNRLRSQYISQIIETDGIVEIAETTELPTDMLEINNDKWSAQSANKGFTKITLPENTLYPTTGNETGDNPDINNYAERLLTFVYGDNTDNKAIYVKGTGTTYVKLKPGTGSEADGYVGGMTSGLYIMNLDGTFTEASSANRTAFIDNDNSIYNQQIYKTEDTYYEVDLESIRYNGNKVEIAYVDNTGTLQYIEITDSTEFWKRNEEADKVQYLTGKVTHYSFADAGEGQNKITLDVNITNIEDAKATNTGFADAYDVKTYIENIFSWVDLSANVSADDLTTNSKFYKELKLNVKVGNSTPEATETKVQEMVNNITSDGTKICYKSGNTFTELENPISSITHLAYDNAGNIVAGNASDKLTGTDFFTLASGTTPYDLYTSQQSVKTNPINMAISKLVKP